MEIPVKFRVLNIYCISLRGINNISDAKLDRKQLEFLNGNGFVGFPTITNIGVDKIWERFDHS